MMPPDETRPVQSNTGSNEFPPDNYLVWAILSTILCCLPLGIVSIVKSTQVNNKWQMGDHEGAIKSAQDAKKWALWSAVAFGIGIVFYILLIVIFGFTGIFAGALSDY